MQRLTLLAVALSTACVSTPREVGDLDPTSGSGAGDSAGSDGSSGGDGDGDGDGSSGDGSSSDGSGSDGSGDGDGDGDGGIKLDVGSGSGSGPGEGGSGDGCQKADFLFVIDASGSMIEDQTRLAAAVPQFIDAVLSTTNAQDFHILVTDVDGAGNGPNGSCGACPTVAAGMEFWFCNGQPCNASLPRCEWTLGAGRRLAQDYTTECGLPPGRRWMDDTQPDVRSTFSCLAQMGGTGANTEYVADSMIRALGDELNAPGACNEGFVRDDAILVVVVVSDDADDNRAMTTQEYYDELVRIKNGNADAVVFLPFISDFDQPGSVCPMDNSSEGVPQHLRELAGMLPGDWTSICNPDYGAFLLDQVGTINETCEDFVPPG